MLQKKQKQEEIGVKHCQADVLVLRGQSVAKALKDNGIKPCILLWQSRGKPIKHDKCRNKRRNPIEIMFSRLQYWRRVPIRYDRCPKVLPSAALAATFVFWL